jgi:hypothetical protein
MLPRIYELRDLVPHPLHPDAYFQKLDEGLAQSKGKLDAFIKLEGWLAALDDAAWTDLKERAVPLLMKRKPGRGWEPLFDAFSEARAYG